MRLPATKTATADAVAAVLTATDLPMHGRYPAAVVAPAATPGKARGPLPAQLLATSLPPAPGIIAAATDFPASHNFPSRSSTPAALTAGGPIALIRQSSAAASQVSGSAAALLVAAAELPEAARGSFITLAYSWHRKRKQCQEMMAAVFVTKPRFACNI